MTDEQTDRTEGYDPTQDPTDGGRLCGARRSRNQTEADDDDGHPFCRNPAGFKTGSKTGRCTFHGGSSPNAIRAARLKMAELVDPAIARLAQILVDEGASEGAVLRAVENVLDRSGHPRTTTVDVEAGREMLQARIERLREGSEDDAPELHATTDE